MLQCVQKGVGMRKYLFLLLLCNWSVMAHASSELTAAIENARNMCGGISEELSDLKKMAGINTAVTAVGTVAGGVALGTGIAKASVDKEIEELEKKITRLKAERGDVPIEHLEIEDEALFKRQVVEFVAYYQENEQELLAAEQELSAVEHKSKNLGNWRTGGLATATVANVAGAVIAGNNRVKGDLKTQIDECLISIKTLSDARMQARISGSANEEDLARAENIVRVCEEWSMVDLGSINEKASGAATSSGVGAVLGLAGTVTSAMANTDSTRSDNSESGKSKEKNLNMASNILAGGTTVAGGVATVFNATQISAIKRAVETAEKCEEALK